MARPDHTCGSWEGCVTTRGELSVTRDALVGCFVAHCVYLDCVVTTHSGPAHNQHAVGLHTTLRPGNDIPREAKVLVFDRNMSSASSRRSKEYQEALEELKTLLALAVGIPTSLIDHETYCFWAQAVVDWRDRAQPLIYSCPAESIL